MKTLFNMSNASAPTLPRRRDILFGRTIEDYVNWNVFNSPNSDFHEEDNCYKLYILVPGMNRKDISIEVDDRIMRVYGRQGNDAPRSQGNFMRSFILPRNADATNIKAKCRDGMLTITVGKVGSQTKRSIRVEGVKQNAASFMQHAEDLVSGMLSKVRSVFKR